MIRRAQPTDADALTHIDLELARDGRGMVITQSQVMPAEQRRQRLAEQTAWVAVEDDVLGYVEVQRLPPERCKHVANLAIGVRPGAQGRGLGKALMEAAVRHAVRTDIERLQLYVRADNPRAVGLYRAFGFEVEGVKKRFVKCADGTYVDDLTMVRFFAPNALSEP